MFENNSMENISITGITPLDYYPCYKDIIQTKQNMQNIDVFIPCEKPDIESIEEVKVNICIVKCKTIDTILGKKIILNGIIKIKIIYTANNCEQSLHSAHWDIPFCDFILLDNICNCDDLNNLDLFAGLEDVCINNNDFRYINLSVLYIICASLYKKQSSCSNQCNKNTSNKNKNSCECKSINSKKGNLNTYYYPVEYY